MLAFVADVATPIQALTVWLSRPETVEEMQVASSDAVAQVEQYILSDTSLRVPRRKEERADGFHTWLDAYVAGDFGVWLASYKHRLAQQIQDEALITFPGNFARVRNTELIREIVETVIWPEIEPILKRRAMDLLMSYAVRGIALAWVCRNVGDNLLLGLPEQYNEGWRVPLHQPDTGLQVAAIVLDHDGEVVSDVDALRTEVESAL